MATCYSLEGDAGWLLNSVILDCWLTGMVNEGTDYGTPAVVVELITGEGTEHYGKTATGHWVAQGRLLLDDIDWIPFETCLYVEGERYQIESKQPTHRGLEVAVKLLERKGWLP